MKPKKFQPRAMLPASLLLESYFVEEFSFSPNEAALTSGDVLSDPLPQDIEVGLELWNHPHEARKIACRVFITTSDSSKNSIAYTIDITLMGIFRVAENYPDERIRPMVRYNAPALLYSAAREYIALTTGRGVAGPLTLPTISFIESKRTEPSQTELEGQSKIPEETPKKVSTRKKKAP